MSQKLCVVAPGGLIKAKGVWDGLSLVSVLEDWSPEKTDSIKRIPPSHLSEMHT